MIAILPAAVRLSITPAADDLVDLDYIETFAAGQEDIVAATAATLTAFGEIHGLHCVQLSPLEIGFRGRCTKCDAGNAMLGEFLVWGDLGSMPLRDLLVGPIGETARLVRAQAAKETLAALDRVDAVLAAAQGPTPTP
jgi:hypothetical protein